MFTIPAYSCRKISTCTLCNCILFKFAFDTPVVRKIKCPPVSIIISWSFSTFYIGLDELPVKIHQKMLACYRGSSPGIQCKYLHQNQENNDEGFFHCLVFI